MNRRLSWLLLVSALLGATTLGCSEEKGKGSSKAKVTAAASGECKRCEREKQMLSSKLKAAQNQIRKLKKQIKAKRSKKKSKAQPAPSATSK
jgi:predicted RNase H-like nuclease (RuvC/YqgF family)